MYDLHRLRLLRELKHRGTLAAVAAALSYGPSSISQQLSLLQTEVGVPLLESVGRRVRLTPQAEILVAHTEALLERMERAEADIASSLAELTGTIRLATFQTAALALVPVALTLLREAHPRLRVHLIQVEPETALPALVARDFDLVVAEEYPGSPAPRAGELDYEDLCVDSMRLALPAAVRDRTQPHQLADHPWIMEPEGSVARHWAMSLCRQAGFEPDVRFESTDVLLHLRLVREGARRRVSARPGLAGPPAHNHAPATARRARRAPGVHRGTPWRRPTPRRVRLPRAPQGQSGAVDRRGRCP